jgi:hypothetical protein
MIVASNKLHHENIHMAPNPVERFGKHVAALRFSGTERPVRKETASA